MLLLLAIGCGGRNEASPIEHGEAMQPTFDCANPIAGLDAHIAPGRLLWFGEMHGTEESPRFVGDVACQAARSGRVQLGLEIWGDEQARIAAYVRSDGTAADRAALLDGPFWVQHDGRSSHAMVALLERVRLLRRDGASIDVVAYDVPYALDRDKAMADSIQNMRDAKAVFVGLSGNIHSRRTTGTPWNRDLVPTIAHLVARNLPVATFDVSSDGGMMWACMSTENHDAVCGEHPNRKGSVPGTPWTLGPARDDTHDGVYFVGPTKATAPARDR